ncbi:TonB-dependent receptor [Maricaulis virginensis]|uniref:Oar protein n=1 Tax=Maricaulis virginensis TaxID=144022 RepID=A0A9W6IMX3_9PROT|nr:TonB-dependent receptor [Maricaulis virginensis]GLK53221.1 Oar protein [Maricaulis virginensis]
MNAIKKTLLGTTACFGLALSAVTGVSVMTAPAVLAQSYTTGGVGGTVLDEAGNPVSGATVTAVSSDRGSTRTVTTGADGRFFIGRLEVGNYTLTAAGAGYQTVSDDGVRVSVGSSAAYEFVLPAGMAEDVITVTGQAVQVDVFQASETGLDIDVQAVFEQVPIGRDVTSLTLLAPGTVIGDNDFEEGLSTGFASISGASPGENAFYVDGMNITDFRNFLGASAVPFQLYDQLEIKSGGYQAEFGRSTGGVVNAVTRSGTNEWHYGFNIFYSPDELREDSPTTYAQANQFDQRMTLESDFWVSGPIIEDRVFIYGLYSPRLIEAINITEAGREEVDRTDDPFFGFRLDVNLFEGHTFAWTSFSDDRATVREASDVTFNADRTEIESRTPVAQTNFLEGGDVNILRYSGAMTDWLTVSVTAGRQTFNQTIAGSTDGNPAILDARDTSGPVIQLGNWGELVPAEGNDTRELIRADADIYANFFGEHNIRIGVDRETLTAEDRSFYSGGVYYRLYDPVSCEAQGGQAGRECVRVRQLDRGGSFETIQTAFYIQDSWQVTDQLNVNIGLRNETFDNRNASGDTFTRIEDQLAPRLGVSYDYFGDGSLELFGFYGRYFLPVATNTNIRMAGAELFTQDWYQFTGLDANDVPQLEGGPFLEELFGDGTVPDTRAVTDQYLDPMYVDEFIIGARWMMNDLWDFSASYTYRDLGVTLEDVAIDAAVIAYCNANGITVGGTPCEDVWTGFHQYVLTNPGEDMRVYLPELDETVDLSAADLGYPTPTRTYEALTLTFDRAFDNGWDLHGSWTLSRSEGNYEGTVKSDNGQDDAGITTSFDQPGLTDNSDGLLPNHRAHKIKLWGNYAFTDQFSVGAAMQATSPRRFGCIGFHPTDDFAQAYESESFFCNSQPTPRGSQLESDWIYNVDLAFIYRPVDLPLGGEPVLRMDIFNVFDSSGVTDIREIGETALNVPDPNYGAPRTYQAPRSVRFGLSWTF